MINEEQVVVTQRKELYILFLFIAFFFPAVGLVIGISLRLFSEAYHSKSLKIIGLSLFSMFALFFTFLLAAIFSG